MPQGVEADAVKLVNAPELVVNVTVPVPVAVLIEFISSKAPISQYVPCGLVIPRWSVAGAPLQVPLLKAGLLVVMAHVDVWPPLFCKGPSCGLVLIWSVGWVK